MLGQRRRRWANIKSTLSQCLVFSWKGRSEHREMSSPTSRMISPAQQILHADPMLVWCWASVIDSGPTSTHHWFYVLCFLGRGRDNIGGIINPTWCSRLVKDWIDETISLITLSPCPSRVMFSIKFLSKLGLDDRSRQVWPPGLGSHLRQVWSPGVDGSSRPVWSTGLGGHFRQVWSLGWSLQAGLTVWLE